MAQRLVLEVPGLSVAYAITLINESLGLIFDSYMWSFQLKENGWLTPGLLFPSGPGNSVGTISVTPYTTVVVGDPIASAAWSNYINNNNLPLFTQLQIRSPYYSLYSVIGVSVLGEGTGLDVQGFDIGGFEAGDQLQLTLDRPWMEPVGAAVAYEIYQCYFPVPVTDFKRFITARDTTNNWPMDYTTVGQKDLMQMDPERTIFDNPVYIVPYEQDHRPGSATYGNMLYELWPHPLSVLPYTYSYLRRGPLMIKPTDTVPYPLTEEVVLWRAKVAGFIWAEAQKGADMQRGAGADYRFLSKMALDEFDRTLKPIKDRDRDLVELYFSRLPAAYPRNVNGYVSQNGNLNVGRW